jgi:putrescine transport system substrate-binding protein
MTKRQAFIFALAFTVLFAVIAGTVPRSAMAQGLRFSPPIPSPLTQGDNKRIAIAQRLLRRLRLLKEEPSGNMTSATQSAIATFARTANPPLPPEVTDELIRRLRQAAWLAATADYVAMKDKYLDAAGIREAQRSSRT